MTKLRVFKKEGINQFIEHINKIKAGEEFEKPDLNINIFSENYYPNIMITERVAFESRLDMAKYLVDIFNSNDIHREDIINNNMLWSWIAYLWLEEFTPEINGKRIIRETARFICSSDYTDYYRHYVANAYDIFTQCGDEYSKIFLYSEPYVISDNIEVFARKQGIISNINLVKVIYDLYWDKTQNKPKTGISTRTNPGHTRRLMTFINQLELTYDVYNMKMKKIMELLPKEFNKWKETYLS